MKTIIANWKMNVGVRESVALARGTLLTLRGRKVSPALVICPPFVALSEVRKIVARSSAGLGAQNMFWEQSGAYTGETSPRMLLELGVSHVILGHSERRALFGETDEMVNKKVLQALEQKLVPIICVGESADQRREGQTQQVVRDQLMTALQGVRLKSSESIMVAYEPLWAIGSGVAATVSDVIETHRFIHSLLAQVFEQALPGQVSVLYGGSVDAENAYGFLREDEVNGVLVGGASVKINQFKGIVQAAAEVLEAKQTS